AKSLFFNRLSQTEKNLKYKNSAKLFFIEYNYVRVGMNLSNYFRHGIIRVITVAFNIIRDCPCNPCLK
ncbi:hypothetical protein DWX51_00005, partial [Bacteroides uniformis]